MKKFLNSTTFLAIVASWLWSTAFVGVKIGLQYQTPFQFAGIRFFISGILLFLYFGNPRQFFTQIRQHPWFILLISLVQITFQYALFYSGLNLVPGALAAMVVGSSPLFVAVFVHFALKNDRMTRAKLLSILIGVAGIAIITLGRANVEMKGEYEWLGILLLIINNFSSGYSSVLVLKKSTGVSPVVLSSSSLMIGGFMLFAVSVPLEGLNMGPFPLEYYLSLGWLSFLSAAAFTIWFGLIKRPGVKISELNVWKFLIPVSGAILSWLLIKDEKPDLISVIGMVVIGLSLIVLNVFGKRKES
ncbi:DMT family transporter [Geofilum sp. OHC36d9]|uniref:DMT family transporter n=1 Tax=Geofilum sp. OHC36d9 TaxID=3458413 RepID=UPI0040333B6D